MPDQLGDFELIEEIGRGGMAVVYRARQRSLERDVAVKVLPEQMAGQPGVAQRFRAEALNMARLSHPSIAQIYMVGDQEGLQHFAMALLPGRSLADRLAGGPLPHAEAIEIGATVADALAHAHAQGIVHRDVKPANILFDAHGRAVVTDFGIARATDDLRLTATGMRMGTPHYMAPEQAHQGVCGPQADIYALGVVLYEMLCGHPPFEGDTPIAVAMKHVRDPVPPLREQCPGVPEWLEGIAHTALAKHPADRFPSAVAMAAALRAGPSRAQQRARRRTSMPLIPVAVTLLLAVLGLAAVGYALFARASVPDVMGREAADARRKVERAGLVAILDYTPHGSSVPDGCICAQDPRPGARCARGASVRLTVSADSQDAGQEVVRAAAERLESSYQSLAQVMVAHKETDRPWEEYKAVHGLSTWSWNAYLRANGDRVLRMHEDLRADYASIRRSTEAVSVPADAPASFERLRSLMAEGAQAGEERMGLAVELIEQELAGRDPSWADDTPFGRAKARYRRLLGEPPDIGGEVRRCHGDAFVPSLPIQS